MIPSPDPADALLCPDADERPMAEGDFQREPLSYAVAALRRHFHDQEQVYVSGNLLIYYEPANPKSCIAADVFVVRGAPRHDRQAYRLSEEPKAPDFVLEITSRSTLSEDQGIKRGLYAFLGVEEYWQYDPTDDYLVPPLKGLRLAGGNYWPIPVRAGDGDMLIGASRVLELELRLGNGALHFHDPVRGRTLLTYSELEEARETAEQALQAAEARADAEARGRRVAEARAAAAEARSAELAARLRDGR